MLARVFPVLVLVSVGCGVPHDPDGTFERVRGDMVRVGIAEAQPWTQVVDGRPHGIEVDLVRAFAAQLAADIEWVVGPESELLEALHRRELDLVAAGLKASTPWSRKVALTRPYLTVDGAEHVLAVPQGENRWLLELERFLEHYDIEVRP